MFETLRYNLKHNRKSVMKSATAWILFTAIILVFIFFGLTPQHHGVAEGGAVAVVNGQVISQAQLADVVERMRRDPRFEQFQALGGDMGNQILQQQAVSQLVEMEVLRQAADKQRLWTSDHEVRDIITSIPVFQENGQFRRDLYLNYLQGTRKSASEFEEEIRREQAVRRTVELFRAALKPLPMEAAKQKELASLKANIEFVSVPTEGLVTPQEVSKADVEAFLKDSANEAKIKDYFESHKDEFSSQEKVRARHILVKAEAGNADSEKKALETAEKVAARAKTEDFAKLAKELSDDPGSKAKGGDLGFFSRGAMVPEFEQVAFSAPIGEVSKPVKSQFGYHIVKVEEKQPASSKTLEESRETIASKLIATEKSRTALADLEADLKKGDRTAVSKFLDAHKLKWEETGAFSIDTDAVPKIGQSDEVARLAFGLSDEKPWADSLVRQGPTAYVIRHKPVPATKDAKAEEMKPEILETIAGNRRSEDALRQWMEGLRKDANISMNENLSARSRGQ